MPYLAFAKSDEDAASFDRRRCRDAADLLTFAVRAAGHDAHVCHTGFQALNALRAYRPDVNFMDIGSPDLDGWEVSRLIREPGPKIIAITAFQSPAVRMKPEEAGIDLHLGKPISMDRIAELLALVAEGQPLA